MSTPRPSPYVWVTWIAGILAGDDRCTFSPWFKANHYYTKRRRDGVPLEWKSLHDQMVDRRASELVADGFRVWVEDQNAFRLKGEAATLGGKPDIIAAHADGRRLVVDCKGGREKGADVWQVLVYMLAAPRTLEHAKGGTVAGEVCYQGGRRIVDPSELSPDAVAAIVTLLRRLGASDPPTAAPSGRECAWCDIGAADCPDRTDAPAAAEASTSDF